MNTAPKDMRTLVENQLVSGEFSGKLPVDPCNNLHPSLGHNNDQTVYLLMGFYRETADSPAWRTGRAIFH